MGDGVRVTEKFVASDLDSLSFRKITKSGTVKPDNLKTLGVERQEERGHRTPETGLS